MTDSAPSLRIGPARTEHRVAVEAMLAATDLPTDGMDDQFIDGFVVAELDGTLVGAAGLERYGDHGLLRSVVVRASHQGRGFGEALVMERSGWAIARKIECVYLLTTTAAPFFTRLGFAQVRRETVPASIRCSPEFAEICPSTATAMMINPAAASTGSSRSSE